MTKEEAIKRIKDWNLDDGTMEVLTAAIPELNENNDDRIRRAIINVFATHKGFEVFYGATVNDILSWLKKQGEPKSADTPVDNVEPKFKVGDWVVRDYINSHDISRVTEVKQLDNEIFGYTLDNGTYFSGPWQESYHLWTIQDAEDGDVLATDNGCPFIYDKDRYNNGLAYYYAGLDWNMNLTLKSPHNMLAHFGSICDVVPATREQRDLLFTKMKEAGYEWDAENKVVKKIERKSDWSEEDKENISMLIDLVESKEESMEVKIELSAWLKSLKDRVQSQPTK